MAKKRGRVTVVLPDGRAKVIIARGDACHNCESAHFCHAIADCTKLETEMLNPLGAGMGDMVSVHLSSTTVMKGAAFLFGISGLFLSFGFCAAYSKRLAARHTLTPTITAVIKRCNPNRSPQSSLRKQYENFM